MSNQEEPNEEPPRDAAGSELREKESDVKTKARSAAVFYRPGTSRSQSSAAAHAPSAASTSADGSRALSAGRARIALASFTTACASLIVAVALLAAPASASEGCSNEARREEQGAASRALPDCRAYELVSQLNQPSPNYTKYFGGLPPLYGTDLYADSNSGSAEPYQMTSTQGEISTARDGDAALFGSVQPNAESSSLYGNLSRREPDGWVGENIIPTRSRTGFLCNAAGYVGFSPNFEQIIVQIGRSEDDTNSPEDCGYAEPPLAPEEPADTGNLFLRDTATHSFQLLNVTPQGAKSYQPDLDAVSSDGSEVIFQSRSRLTPDAPNGEAIHTAAVEGRCEDEFGDVYVWSAGAVHLLTVTPDGVSQRGELASEHPGECGIKPARSAASYTHSVSSDGERALFYAGGGREYFATHGFYGEETYTVNGNAPYIDGGLYLREHPDAQQSALNECTEAEQKIEAEKACTIQIDVPEGGSGAAGGGQFQWANAETTKIFFSDVEKLTPGSTAAAGKPDLYEYDLEKPAGQRLTDLTGNATEPADVLGVSGASEDGSYLYFAAKGNLTGAQQNSHGAAALSPAAGTGTLTEGSTEVTGASTTSGAFEAGMAISAPGIPAHSWIMAVGAGTLTLSNAATASGAQALSATAANLYLRHAGATIFIANLNAEGGDQCDWTQACLTARVSQNGVVIAFDSLDSLTGYDSHPLHPEACVLLTEQKESPCMEAFRFAADSGANGELTCATCNPSGARPASEFAWSLIPWPNPELGTEGNEMQLTNAVSNSGQVFFQTMEKLLPGDENETWDVYEYEGGEGPGAQLHLISSGKSELPSYLVDATPDGSNVFFVTAQSLVRADTRTDYDLYDARVNGGFPEPPPEICEAEGCKPAYPGAPGGASPASASFEGKGNVHPPAGKSNPPPAKCKKGFVKKKGKCVKQRKKKSKKAKTKKSKKSIRRVAK
jgi:hypothetical protein